MSDDLVKRLTDHIAVFFDDKGHVFENETLCDEAADRIEELEAKLDWVITERDETFALMLDRAQTAEAKLSKSEALLAKAVDALQVIEDASRFFARDRESANTETLSYAHETTRRLCSTTLAELKGEADAT